MSIFQIIRSKYEKIIDNRFIYDYTEHDETVRMLFAKRKRQKR